jgi:hypothetical protein
MMIFRRVLMVCWLVMGIACLGEAAWATNNPVPVLYQPLSPAAVAPGSAGLTLTVRGLGFVSGAVLKWNGSARTTTFVSGTEVTAAIPSSDLATAGAGVITVTNPAPGGGTSNGEYFQVTNATVGLGFEQSLIPSGAKTSQGRPAVGDFNGDGKLDVAVPANDNTVHILLGNGDGSFQPAVSVPAAPSGTQISDVAVGDFNGDGKADLAVSYHDVNQVSGTSVVLGNGDGSFQAPVTSAMSQTQDLTGGMTLVADVNGDGIPDLVRACHVGVCVELGNGEGTFRAPFVYIPPVTVNIAPVVSSVTLGDFNGDGKLDIALAVEPHYLVMLPGNGDGTFGTATLLYGADAVLVDSVVAVDLDGDGKLDLAFFYRQDIRGIGIVGALSLLRGNGDGTFQAPLTLPGLPGMDNAVLIAGDFNGDGQIDLAVQNVVVVIGSFSLPVSYRVIPTGQNASVAGDFNGDGRLDLAGEDQLLDELHLLLQGSPTADFRGSVDPVYQTVVTGGTASYPITVTGIDGFGGTVAFSASGLPAGATASFAPSTVTGSGATTLTITTTGTTPTGSYPLLLTGTSGSLTHSGAVTLNVGPAGMDFTDFAGAVQPSYRTITPGASTTYDISSSSINGFNGSVNLSVGGLPAGATASFSPSAITGGSGASVLTVTTLSGSATGSYPLMLAGTGGGHTHNTVVNLNVGPAGTNFSDFSGSVTPDAQTVAIGGSTTFTVSVQSINGPSDVFIEVLGDPAGTNVIETPSNPIAGGTGSVVLTFTPSAQTPPGTYTVTIVSTNRSVSHTRNITLTVTP